MANDNKSGSKPAELEYYGSSGGGGGGIGVYIDSVLNYFIKWL